MSKLCAFIFTMTIGLLPSFGLAADAAMPFDDRQKAAVESIVRDLLTTKEPEIIMTAAQNLQEKMEKEAEVKGKEALGKYIDKIHNDPNSPVGGNPKGDVTMVEFFDYGCGYCKMAQEAVLAAMKTDKNIRFVYKEFPILGEPSLLASKAALASAEQGKYVAFHESLMASKERPSMDGIKKIAANLKLDVDKLVKDMESEKIATMIKDNRALAEKLQIRGTPGFVIGEKAFPGALTVDQITKAVAEARKAAKK